MCFRFVSFHFIHACDSNAHQDRTADKPLLFVLEVRPERRARVVDAPMYSRIRESGRGMKNGVACRACIKGMLAPVTDGPKLRYVGDKFAAAIRPYW